MLIAKPFGFILMKLRCLCVIFFCPVGELTAKREMRALTSTDARGVNARRHVVNDFPTTGCAERTGRRSVNTHAPKSTEKTCARLLLRLGRLLRDLRRAFTRDIIARGVAEFRERLLVRVAHVLDGGDF